MSVAIRLLLIFGSLCSFWFAMRYIRKSKVRIEDTFFWVFLSIALILLSLFPDVAIEFTRLLQMQSPINFVFLIIIFLLLMKQFFMSIKLSQLEIRIKELAQQVAIDKKDRQDKQ